MTTTNERTGKFWKLLMLLSIVAIFWGGYQVWGYLSLEIENGSRTAPVPPEAVKGMASFLGGLAGFVVARIGAWWFHG